MGTRVCAEAVADGERNVIKPVREDNVERRLCIWGWEDECVWEAGTKGDDREVARDDMQEVDSVLEAMDEGRSSAIMYRSCS